jgi:hypothetical protein
VRVTFPRLPDHQRGYAVIERDDGVVYRMGGGPVDHRLPHDVVHFVVEDRLGLANGIWGAIAGGMVYRSMEHVSGRRPPHAAERSAALKREFGQELRWAELVGGFVEYVAHEGIETAEAVRRLPRQHYGTLAELVMDPAAVLDAAGALREAEASWAALGVGEELRLEWPGWRRMTPKAEPDGTGRSRRVRRAAGGDRRAAPPGVVG